MSVLRHTSLYNNTRIKALSTSLSAGLLALMLSGNANALEDGFMGLQIGSASSLDTDSSSTSFKLLTGAHVTSRLTLEFAYLNLGTNSFKEPKAENLGYNKDNISFSDAKHGEISYGQLGDPTVNPDTNKNEYKNKGDSSFTGIDEFSTHGALINLRYRFPINDEFDFFVKTGFFAWVVDYEKIKLTASQTTPGLLKMKDDSGQTFGVNAISGAGFIYHPTKDVSLRAELESSAISSEDMPRTRIQNITLGVNWEF